MTKNYVVCHLDQDNNEAVASQLLASYSVSLSGGLASAAAAERVIQRYVCQCYQ